MAFDLGTFVLKVRQQFKSHLLPLFGREISKHGDRSRKQYAITKQALGSLLDVLKLSLDFASVVHHKVVNVLSSHV